MGKQGLARDKMNDGSSLRKRNTDVSTSISSPHLQLVIFGAKRCVLLPDHLLQLSDQLLSLGEPFSHFLHRHLSSGGSQRRAWTLKRVGRVKWEPLDISRLSGDNQLASCPFHREESSSR